MAGGVPSTLFVTRLAQLITIARRSPLGAYQYIVHPGLNGIVLLPLKLFSTGILELSFLKAVDDLLMRLGMPNLLRSLRRQSPHRRALRGGLERFRALT
jgi:hypothetical protein